MYSVNNKFLNRNVYHIKFNHHASFSDIYVQYIFMSQLKIMWRICTVNEALWNLQYHWFILYTHYLHKWISCISIQDVCSLSHNLYLEHNDENYSVEHSNIVDEYFTSKDCFWSSSHSLSWDDKSFKLHWCVCCNWISESAHSWIMTWLSISEWEIRTFWKFVYLLSTLSDRFLNSWLSVQNINCVMFNSHWICASYR